MTVLLKISVDVISKLSGEYEALGKIASVRMKNRDWVCSGKQPHELHQVWQPSLANSKHIIKLMVFLEGINSNSTSRSLTPTPSTQWSSGQWLVSTPRSSIPYFLLLFFFFFQNCQSKFQGVSEELCQYSILYSTAENKFLQPGRESWTRRISEGWQTTWGDWVIVIGGTNFNGRLKTPLELWEVIWNDVWRN